MLNMIVVLVAFLFIPVFGNPNKQGLGIIHNGNATLLKAQTSHAKVLNRREALEIARQHGFKGTGKDLQELSKEYFSAKSDEEKKLAKESLVDLGLIPAKNQEGKYVWKAK